MTQSETTSAAGGGEPGLDHYTSLAWIDRKADAAETVLDQLVLQSLRHLVSREILEAAAPTGKGGTIPNIWHVVICLPGLNIDHYLASEDKPTHDQIDALWRAKHPNDDRPVRPCGWDGPLRDAYPGVALVERIEVQDIRAVSPPPPAGAAGGGAGDPGSLSAGADRAEDTAITIHRGPHGEPMVWLYQGKCPSSEINGVSEWRRQSDGLVVAFPANFNPNDGQYSAPTPNLGAQGEPVALSAGDLVAMSAAVIGISDDYMTSENHHPSYVLIPAAKFEELCRAEASLLALVSEIGTQGEPAGSADPLDRGRIKVPFAHCCGMDPATCDCVNPDHGHAWIKP